LHLSHVLLQFLSGDCCWIADVGRSQKCAGLSIIRNSTLICRIIQTEPKKACYLWGLGWDCRSPNLLSASPMYTNKFSWQNQSCQGFCWTYAKLELLCPIAITCHKRRKKKHWTHVVARKNQWACCFKLIHSKKHQ
jgi:hypothetical protein